MGKERPKHLVTEIKKKTKQSEISWLLIDIEEVKVKVQLAMKTLVGMEVDLCPLLLSKLD
jgi:hypothetical protein